MLLCKNLIRTSKEGACTDVILNIFYSNPKPLVILGVELCWELELCPQGSDGQWSVLL